MTEQEFNMRLGSALRYERRKKHMTLDVVAEKLGMSRATVAFWETGERTITAKQWKQYCDLLGMSLDEFVEKHGL